MAPQTTTVFGKDNGHILPAHLTLLAATTLKQESDMYFMNSTTMLEKLPIENNEKDHAIEIEEEEDDEDWNEERLVIEINCSVERMPGSKDLSLKLLLRLEDTMNRQLNKTISESQTGIELATELALYGLINELDITKVGITIQDCIDDATS